MSPSCRGRWDRSAVNLFVNFLRKPPKIKMWYYYYYVDYLDPAYGLLPVTRCTKITRNLAFEVNLMRRDQTDYPFPLFYSKKLDNEEVSQMAQKPCAIVHAFSKLTPSRIVFLVVSNDSLAFSKALRAIRSLLTSEIRGKRRSTFRGRGGEPCDSFRLVFDRESQFI